jgi:hypothetical protein
MKNLIISILAIVVLAISGWLFVSLTQLDNLKKNNQTLQNKLSNFQIIDSQKSDLAIRNFFHSQIDFNKLKLRTLNNLDTLINLPKGTNDLYLIAYFDSSMCSVCLDREWSNFDWLHKQFPENFILLTKGYPSPYFFQKNQFSLIHDKIFVLENEITDFVDSPIYFLWNGKTLQSFQVEKNTNDTFELIKLIISKIS